MMAAWMVEQMELLMADMQADEMARWRVQPMVYWMVEWWAVEKDETMVATTAVCQDAWTVDSLDKTLAGERVSWTEQIQVSATAQCQAVQLVDEKDVVRAANQVEMMVWKMVEPRDETMAAEMRSFREHTKL